MTKQEIFDKVLNHMRQQGKLSRSDNGFSCLYKSPDGCKCAVGVLIPDEEFHISFNDMPLCKVVNNCPTLIKIVQEHGMMFLESLQGYMHDWIDQSEFDFSLDRGTRKFASLFGLKYYG